MSHSLPVTKRRQWFLFAASLLIFVYLIAQVDYAPFSLLGVLGAIFANATGAGGGVVFIPAFQALDISAEQSVATSFAIQCFGMTTGALLWSRFAKQQAKTESDWRLAVPFLLATVPASILGLWFVYGGGLTSPASLSLLFAWFSILLGCALFVAVLKKNLRHQVDIESRQANRGDLLSLIVIGFVGGIVTAWLSVGVGEFVAFYLIVRGYRVTLAVAVAVILSALTVWAGIGFHLAADTIHYQILMFAGPGAVFGAIIAKLIATRLPVMQLKLFFAGWVLLVGVIELITH